MSPGSPSSGAAPTCMESSSTAETLCSTQSFHPCLAARRMSLPVRFPAPERGFRARMMLHARLVADCGARSTCLGDLKVTSACTQPPHRGRISLAQIQHSSPRFVVLLSAAPQGIPSAGFRGGPCTASGCPTAGSPWLSLPWYRHRVSRHSLQGEKPGLGAELLGSCLPWVGAASGAEFAQILAVLLPPPCPTPFLLFLPLGADGWW